MIGCIISPTSRKKAKLLQLICYVWFGLLANLISGCGLDKPAPKIEDLETVVPSLRYFSGIGGDFSLIDQQGNPFLLSEQKAEAVLLFFGYTFCPDVCPLTMSKIAQVYDQLKVGPEQLLTVFISVDSVRDTPQILKEYLGYFSVGAIGLSGSEEVLGRVIEMFGAQYRIDESTTGNYLINHSTGTYLLDAKKAVRFLFDHQDSATKMALVVQALFNEQSKNVVTSGTVGVDTSLIFTLLQYPGICGASPVGNIMDDSFWFIDNQTAANRVPIVPLPQPTFPFGLTHRQ